LAEVNLDDIRGLPKYGKRPAKQKKTRKESCRKDSFHRCYLTENSNGIDAITYNKDDNPGKKSDMRH
jgi:hypothetical protein